MDGNNVKIKENLTFYRKMANTNISIMKKYKSAVVNKMNYKNILNIYSANNLNFKEDVERLKLFFNKSKKDTKDNLSDTMSEPTEILTETSECSEPSEDTNNSIIEKKHLDFYNFNNIISNNIILLGNKNIKRVIKNVSEYTNIIISNKNYIIPILIPVLISSVLYARRSQK